MTVDVTYCLSEWETYFTEKPLSFNEFVDTYRRKDAMYPHILKTIDEISKQPSKLEYFIQGFIGSGKSTLLNNMIDLIPYNQSVLVSQESDELYSNEHPQIQFEHTMTIRKNDVVTDFSLEDELRLGLLQDIDNFIIGEIKGGEALYVFTTAMSTGARFFGTIHSNDAASSVTRLAQCARYVSDYPMETLEEMLTCMPFVLVHMSHFSIDEILEVDGFDEARRRLNFKEVYLKEGVR